MNSEAIQHEHEVPQTEEKQHLNLGSKITIATGGVLTVLAACAAVYVNITMAPAISIGLLWSFVDVMSVLFIGTLGTGCIVVAMEAISEIF